MSKKLKKYLLFLNVFILFFFTIKAIMKEEVYKKQESFYLRLEPIDPRSLLQGDYMILNYDILVDTQGEIATSNLKKGFIIVSLDEQKIAFFKNISPIKSDEENKLSIPFSYNRQNINIGANTFLFQEGLAEYYERATYAQVVLTDNSLRILNLTDKNFKPIKKEK